MAGVAMQILQVCRNPANTERYSEFGACETLFLGISTSNTTGYDVQLVMRCWNTILLPIWLLKE